MENFVRLLTGRHPENTPRSKRLLTDAGSNILIYMTGEVLKTKDIGAFGSFERSEFTRGETRSKTRLRKYPFISARFSNR